MSKREILMMRKGLSLVPCGDTEADALAQVRTTKPVLVTVHQARNPDHHAKLWKLADKVANFDPDFEDGEDAIEWAKIHIPNMRRYRQRLDGSVIVSTRSISFASMDQIAFGRFYDRCLYLWAQKIGTNPEDLLNAGDPPA